MWAMIFDQSNHGRYEKELEFYSLELIGLEGCVLELAFGTGMILLPLLKAGVDIYGIDVVEEMLEVLFRKAHANDVTDIRSRVSRQDMRDFHFDQTFNAVIIPARSFLHLTSQDDQIAFLRNIHTHLYPGGQLMFNFFNPDKECLTERSNHSADWIRVSGYNHPETGEEIILSFKQMNDLSAQLQHITWRFNWGESTHHPDMTVRWIYKEEFQLLLRLAGFQSWKLYGGFDRSDFAAGSTELIWMVEKR